VARATGVETFSISLKIMFYLALDLPAV
jgi:hypothetical protein